MKKLFYVALILTGTLSLYAQTVTTSNAAVFDGDNLSNSPIVKFGKSSNGGVYEFNSRLLGNGGEMNYDVKDVNNTQRNGYLANDSSDVITYSGVNGGFFYQLFNLPNGTFMSLTNSQSQLIIGGDVAWGVSHKLIVSSGNSFFDGNVGIGTESFIDANDNNQEYRLSVDGKVRADAVKVYTDWADYVFEKDYNLPTLEEVEKHIKNKGHLKDIPSAKEVEANGIDVGEMNKLLLQKVEELTLYLLNQDKEIKTLKEKVNLLESKQ